MGRGIISVFSLALLAFISVQCEELRPMVAFMCNKPAMYLSKDGWKSVKQTDCMKDPVEILNFCKKMYPEKSVTNVVRATDKVSIDNWCVDNKKHCHHHKHSVIPYKCLVGPYQSAALLVPEDCVFDHIHDNKKCNSDQDWRETASKACESHGMKWSSSAPLSPCGISRFQGVEYVCCPPAKAHEKKHGDNNHHEKPEVTTPAQQKEHKQTSANDIYSHYLHNTRGRYLSEHEYFLKAKSDLEKHHHEKVTKMMKEWASARQRVQQTKATDPKGAEKLNKEITARFQKTYQALEQEGMAEKKQLVALHQQRVQASLNEKKRHSIEHLMEVLDDKEPDAASILKALKHYIKTEQKDREHSANHFKHVINTDPLEGETIRTQTLEHIHIIDQRIQQAIDMLNRVPKFEKKIRQQITDYLKTFEELDATIAQLLAKPKPKTTNTKILQQYKQDESQKTHQGEDVHHVEKTEELHHVELHKEDLHVKLPAKYDDEVWEDESDIPKIKTPEHVGHMGANELNFKQQDSISQKRMVAEGSGKGTVIGFTVGTITVFVIIVVGVIVLRRKATRAPPGHGFVEVDQAVSPEERHVTKMQMNGYENPTYKYFEMNTNA